MSIGRLQAVDSVDPEVIELIRERDEQIDLFTEEIVKFREQAVGLDMNGPEVARYLATRLVEAICE
jgi:hypothetical protein